MTADAPVLASNDAVASRRERTDDVILRVDHLRKYYGEDKKGADIVRAVDDVSFAVRAGRTLSLVGESGCGKTTTARCIVRALKPSAGHIWFKTQTGATVDLAEMNAAQMRPIRSQIQMVFQDPYSSLNPRLPVLDIIAEPLVINGMTNKAQLRERVGDLLELVGLRREHQTRYPNAFSGGQRQRIGIARALALQPRLIVADEAVSALDVSVQAQILNLLLDLQDKFRLSYVFVAHDLSVVRHISDDVGVMYVGQMVELASCDTIFEKPLHPYTAALLAAAPKPDPRLRRTHRPPPGETASPRNPPSGCYFHPRCAFAVDRCHTEKPVWEEARPDRFVRCHRAKELDLQGVTA